jgi:anti-sigma factor RsiW
MAMNTHPTDQELLAWLDGEADPARSDTIAAHVEQCARCEQAVEAVEQLGRGLRSWAEDRAPAPRVDLADAVLRTAAPPTTATVIPLASRSRRWQPAAAVAALLAAAAAGVFALRSRPVSQPTTTRPAVVAVRTDAGPVERVLPPPETQVAMTDPGGSEVLAVDVEGAHTSYSVVEIEGTREGSTVAVVWIEDESETGSSGVE